MTDQQAFEFNPSRLHRTTDPETSVDAAEAAGAIIAGHEGMILRTLHSRRSRVWSGLTSEEIGDVTGLGHVAVARRMRAMADRGLVIETSERRVNRSGIKAIVWKAWMP